MAAAAKIKVSDVAKRMGKSEKDLIFQLQSLGAEVTDANQVLEPEVIQALITGKKLLTRTRSVIMREDKPLPEKKKEAVRPPRPIVQPPVRKKVETPKEEPAVAPPPTVIIPEFQEAAEAEERAAKEAPVVEKPKVEKPKKVQVPEPVPVEAEAAKPEAPAAAAEAPAPPPPPAVPHHPVRPAAHAPTGVDRRPTGPTGPRARAPQGPRPNYAGQQTVPTGRPTGAPSSAPRPSGPGAPMTEAKRIIL